MFKHCRLGINIDHIATLRNARGEGHPSLLEAARIVEKTKADSITMHLREDRRHILDDDLFKIKKKIQLPINLEIAPTLEMVEIAKTLKPHSICFVPEKRDEITTEGGLDIIKNYNKLKDLLKHFNMKEIKVACFIDPDIYQLDKIKNLGIDTIEFHTGKYALATLKNDIDCQLNSIVKAVDYANNLGLNCHAGHGLNFKNVTKIASIKQIQELNIGHFLIGESIFLGLENVIMKMQKMIKDARK